ncbi:hypothetical protein, partial [Nocardia cyriacigeorgica]|uniref:hypothetical protein n=1 Tax=Nocardia cyriacigeorgica TaxID=135487 RepID=UPI0024563295
LLKRLRDKGNAVLVVEHDPDLSGGGPGCSGCALLPLAAPGRRVGAQQVLESSLEHHAPAERRYKPALNSRRPARPHWGRAVHRFGAELAMTASRPVRSL